MTRSTFSFRLGTKTPLTVVTPLLIVVSPGITASAVAVDPL
jgi:hypothetical protein